jgi:hypothetical protein
VLLRPEASCVPCSKRSRLYAPVRGASSGTESCWCVEGIGRRRATAGNVLHRARGSSSPMDGRSRRPYPRASTSKFRPPPAPVGHAPRGTRAAAAQGRAATQSARDRSGPTRSHPPLNARLSVRPSPATGLTTSRSRDEQRLREAAALAVRTPRVLTVALNSPSRSWHGQRRVARIDLGECVTGSDRPLPPAPRGARPLSPKRKPAGNARR